MPPVPATPCAFPKLLGRMFPFPKTLPGARSAGGTLVRLLCLLFTLAAAGPAAAMNLADLVDMTRESRRSFFGSVERKVGSPESLPQWSRILRHAGGVESVLSACLADSSACTTPSLRKWRATVTATLGLSRLEQLAAVNDFFNQWPYRTDRELYGLREYWATPREFMARSGDCEDYAIAKFFTLRALGFANDELRIVALTDRIRRMTHAVVTVRQGGEVLVLDSLSNLILPQDRYRHYVAHFSVNETTRWDHFGSARATEPTIFQRRRPGDS